ncbi:class I SAM-dependent methyltransferase [Halomonas profundus]|nr:class I SAM-dependent methyltransferase [Halomonas profundus]
MRDEDKSTIVSRYRKRLGEYGPGIQALASGSVERRDIRFSVLSSIGDLNGCRLLDLGCGLGDFYAWLQKQGVQVSYTGYDITPELVDFAVKRFPKASFEVRDIQTQGIPERFDYIVSSQTFNNRLSHDDNFDVMKDVLQICYEACDVAVAIDMMTSYVDFREDHLYYYQPEAIFSYAKTLTKRVSLRHDYPAFEFAILLYKDFSGWKT